jgi:hypothetical protein
MPFDNISLQADSRKIWISKGKLSPGVVLSIYLLLAAPQYYCHFKGTNRLSAERLPCRELLDKYITKVSLHRLFIIKVMFSAIRLYFGMPAEVSGKYTE